MRSPWLSAAGADIQPPTIRVDLSSAARRPEPRAYAPKALRDFPRPAPSEGPDGCLGSLPAPGRFRGSPSPAIRSFSR